MRSKYLFLFVICLFSLCCTSQDDNYTVVPTSNPNTETPDPEPETKGPFTYLALGDSYTIGHSVPENERFPVQLSSVLNAAGYEVTDTRIVAKTGWTTDELQAGIANETGLSSAYHFVSLLIGVNNQYRNRPVETYEPEFTSLLERAIEFAAGNKDRVFVVSIPDYAYTPFGDGNTNISDGIDIYNATNKEITEAMGVRYFDITPISREGLDRPELVASDGLHPSGEQYRRWVELMFPGVKEMLD
ncbi:MAG: SGNH/GDSL hydrolase family protein [Bacteroidota bacterium]